MDKKKLLKSYLAQGKVMQIASVVDAQPWICTVYFVPDDDMNLYWLSLPSSRHSLEIAQNNQVAVAVPVKFDLPVAGIQAEGSIATVNDPSVIEIIMKKYVEKYDSGKAFYDNFVAGKNKHVMYRFSPASYVLFDEVNFPENGRQEVSL